MTRVDTSALYHVVRGQSVIKLYVIYNMLEVGVSHTSGGWGSHVTLARGIFGDFPQPHTALEGSVVT